jgi:hypothetical protein
MRTYLSVPNAILDIPEPSKKHGDGERPVAMSVLVASDGTHVQFLDYGVLNGIGHKPKE